MYRHRREFVAFLERFTICLQYDYILHSHPQRRLGRLVGKADDMFLFIDRAKDTQLRTSLASDNAEILRAQRHESFFHVLLNVNEFPLFQESKFYTAQWHPNTGAK